MTEPERVMTNRTFRPRAALAMALAWFVAALVLGTLSASPVRAASSVDIQVRVLMGGRYEVGGWAAVAVTLVNDGEPTEGNLTAETEGGTVQRFVEMPAGARKVVTLYVQPEAFQRRVTVEYREPNGTVEAEGEIRVLEQTGSQLAIVGDGGGTLRPQITAGLDESAAEPIVLAPADIPERPEPLEGIAAMVWAADSSALSEAQRRSIERWIAGGGELLVVGGADWQSRTAGFGDILPITELAAVDAVPHDALAEWVGADTPASATDTVATGALHDESMALVTADDGTVLLSMRPVGAGRTILIGTDLAAPAYAAWDGAPRLWSRVVPSTTDYSQVFGGGMPIGEETLNAMTQALGNLPSLDVPPAELLLVVIVGYILLIGPISYVVLRRMDRRELAWVTAPVLVVLFTGCSFGIGNALKGSDVVTNQIALVRTSTAGGSATVQTYAGIFSPQRASYDLSVDADALLARLRAPNFGGPVRETAPVTIAQGNPARLEDLAISVYGFEGVRADAVIDYEPSLSVSWRREDGDLIGTVTNTGDATLVDVAYVSMSFGERIGDLAPGEEAEFEVPDNNFQGSSAADQVYGFGGFDPSSADAEDRTMLMRRHVIDSLVGYGAFMPGMPDVPSAGRGPFIVAWRADEGPVPVVVEDLVAQRHAQTAEVLSVRHPLGTGEVTLRPAQMSLTVIETEGDANSGGAGMIFLGEGSATFGVALPLEASRMAVSELEIIIGPDAGMVFQDQGGFGGGFWPAGYIAEVRNPQTGEWVELGDIAQDSTFEIEDPATAISPAGRIEVRVTGGEVNQNFGHAGVFVSAEVTGVIDE
jgi:hypothetical protein